MHLVYSICFNTMTCAIVRCSRGESSPSTVRTIRGPAALPQLVFLPLTATCKHFIALDTRLLPPPASTSTPSRPVHLPEPAQHRLSPLVHSHVRPNSSAFLKDVFVQRVRLQWRVPTTTTSGSLYFTSQTCCTGEGADLGSRAASESEPFRAQQVVASATYTSGSSTCCCPSISSMGRQSVERANACTPSTDRILQHERRKRDQRAFGG